MNNKKTTPPSSSETAQSVPGNLRSIILAIVLAHLTIVAICLTSSFRVSSFGINLLSLLSPYVVTTNLRMDLQPLAITNPTLLEVPIEIEFQSEGSNQWVPWSTASRTNESLSFNKIRQQRYFGQIAGLLEVNSEDGIATVVAAMLNDLESNSRTKSFDRFRVVHLPVVRPEEWEYAERFRKEGNLPEGLQPEVVMAASIVRLQDGTIGILSEEEDYRTSPVIKP